MNKISLIITIALAAFLTSVGFAAEEAQKLQATGIFVKNEKGAMVFTDDKDKKKYYAFNKTAVKKVSTHAGKKVKINARVKKKEGAKISLITWVGSIKPVDE